jgi:hypothetical protein
VKEERKQVGALHGEHRVRENVHMHKDSQIASIFATRLTGVKVFSEHA